MIRFLTAGESHGKVLTTTIEGFPSNLKINKQDINLHLKRRQAGYGRGSRMQIENDSIEILSGVRGGKTLGSPISFLIKNNDWENWSDLMDTENRVSPGKKITIPRPGHADLVGALKYNFEDIRNSIERSSARETAARVAAGSVARIFLKQFAISVGSFVESIGGIYSKENFTKSLIENEVEQNFNAWSIAIKADESLVRVLDAVQEKSIISKIKSARKNGDTLGGTFVVVVTGVPVGLGSFMHFDRKLDAAIASSIISINAVKAVEIGPGFEVTKQTGSKVHDEIIKSGKAFLRKTNHAGGIEGGISTGMPIIIRGGMKPISTLMNPIETVDLSNGRKLHSRTERSDFVAVPACSVVAESMLAWTVTEFFIEKFGGDSMEEIYDNYRSYTGKLYNRIIKNMKK